MSNARIIVAVIVTAIWALVVFYATVIDHSLLQIAQLVTPVMLAVVGWLFTDEFLRKRTGAKDAGT
jgi:hypothetical protein